MSAPQEWYRSYEWNWDAANNVAVLTEPFHDPMPYTLDSLELTVSNIRAERAWYATENDYVVHLNKFNAGIAVARRGGGSVEVGWIDS